MRLASFLLLLLPLSLHAAPPEPAQVEFFEKRIRPILVQHCYACHSAEAKKSKGGLLLDTRDGLRKGGDNGPALVAGMPEKSLLLKALRHEGPEMPPKEKLPAAVVVDFEKWIAQGAYDPRETNVSARGKPIDFTAARQHWAYQPLRAPVVPPIANRQSPIANPLDAFVLARLQANGLTLSKEADRRTLIRRLTYDLLGLPPTAAEVEAFIRDSRPDAYERLVERLLASPHYGERWGRHWLDVARYADTKDLVLVFGPDRLRPYAYTYRDYVVRALNEDTPYDRFVHEQLAADQLDLKGDNAWRLAAMGFLTLGRLFDNNPPDVFDDQIDTVTRGLLGLTVSCARCHDHKYDAVPTADYYSLYGVFASSETPLDLPRLNAPGASAPPGAIQFEIQLGLKRKELQQHIDAQYQQITETARQRVGDYLVKIATEKPDPLEGAVFYLSLSPEDLKPQILSRWRRYLEKNARPDDAVFGPWHDLMTLADERFAAEAPAVVARWQKAEKLNPLVKAALASATLNGRGDVARLYGDLLGRVNAETNPGPATPEQQPLVELLTTADGPIFFPKRATYLYMSRVDRGTYNQKRQELDKLAVRSPAAPPRGMVLVDAPDPVAPRVFVRGNPSQLGESVPRQFLRILAGEERQPFAHGSGRLDLARAITAPDNPLTARVLVNRVWMHHFGEPLVATPSDFGVRSTPPTHPELLDYLAHELQTHGWSLKHLHRLIVTSSTYRQSSAVSQVPASDPDNHLLWRMNRRRLDFEAMRDTLLAVSGRLERALGGRAVDVAGDPLNRRRTLYGLVDRQDLPGLYRAFDFAVPDQSVERRPQTAVPQQALFGLNSAFVIEQAKALAARSEVVREQQVERRVAALYRLVLARAPKPAEVELAVRFVSAATEDQDSQLTAWEQYAQVLLLTSEGVFVD